MGSYIWLEAKLWLMRELSLVDQHGLQQTTWKFIGLQLLMECIYSLWAMS